VPAAVFEIAYRAIRENARRLGGRAKLVDNDQGSGTLLIVEWSHAQEKTA
jgi:hypothetical protein